MQLRTVSGADFANRRAIVRVDFNVPLKDGAVADDTRIRAALPTISHLVAQGARIVLCSHLGRPKGQVRDELRLDPVAPVLQELLNERQREARGPSLLVIKCDDCVGEAVAAQVERAAAHDVILLENLRFHPGEELNDPDFARQLAALADVYVSDAFGTVHRAHASTEGVAHLLPAYAGFLVENEVEALSKVIRDPGRPLAIVLGGAKISGKIEVLEHLLPAADYVLIGGAMANTFLAAQGLPTGRSLVEKEMVETAARMLALATKHNTELLLPLDYVVTDDLEQPGGASTVAAGAIGLNDIAADIGEKTCRSYRKVIEHARTVFWNGPMGVFETEQFSHGTMAIAQALAGVYNTAHTVVGGGESVSAVQLAGVGAKIHHVSTGGGASLEFVAGRELPGLKVLEQ